MYTIEKISVSEKTNSSLVSREAVFILFEKLSMSKCSVFELDFRNIEFMSRSYADQFYKAKLEFEKNQNIKLHISNANEKVIKMLEVVSKTQNAINRHIDEIPVYKFTESKKLSDYLHLI